MTSAGSVTGIVDRGHALREELLDAAAEIDFASMTNAQIEAALALAASNNEDEDDGEDDDWGHMRGRNG